MEIDCESIDSSSNITPERRPPRWSTGSDDASNGMRTPVNKDRVRSITERLSRLQDGIENDKNKSKVVIETKLKELEKMLRKLDNEKTVKFDEIDQQTEQIIEAIGQERLARELLDERKTKESELVMKSVDLKIEEFKNSWDRFIEQREKELDALNDAFEEEKSLRAESEEKYGVQLSDQVSKLAEQLNDLQNKVSTLTKTTETLETENTTLRKQLASEEKARLDLEAHVVGLMEDLYTKVRADILSERGERESVEETLLKLIEETCSRVEGGLM